MEAGFYSKKREGVIDIDPKVFEPFEPIPGRAPRKVVIDRKKKLYASLMIINLLREESVDYSKENHSWLPLEPFDDSSFDERPPEEWL